MTARKSYLRLLFVFFVVAPSGGVFLTHTGSVLASVGDGPSDGENPVVHQPAEIRSADDLTLVTAHYDDAKNGSLKAFTDDGEVVYETRAHQRIFDVDPVPGEKYTVTYVGSTVRSDSACKLDAGSGLSCIRNVVQRVNLSTGESERMYNYDVVTRHGHDSVHDVDRINESHYLVADIFHNRAFIVNTSANVITWEWRARSEFPYTTGGAIRDWTHINDVEYLEDQNVVMIDPRNHDQIWFVHRQKGLLENRTLGADDDHSVLYEQHNPDYIPAERGGPSVVVADSENNRIVEYQREDGPDGREEWNRTWTWRDAKMEWPRDADRLPNGNTLITDTHSNRIFEVTPAGEIVWQVSMAKPYEAERLGTGDESAGGQSATALGYESRTPEVERGDEEATLQGRIYGAVRSVLPTKLYHGIRWMLPAWMGLFDILLVAISGLSLVGWVVSELYWTDRIGLRNPIRLGR
ncbi:arylsulfotransferase (asst) [Halorussus lipolyticus]|uniref:arylsulfotransferase (asst) n=1 Tax=Halorussus lipolyticus TaxID=3034024 RepID=UPI0023E7D7D7|nr:arylsulfotransferase (asst) [Halorussus sp. DT80]